MYCKSLLVLLLSSALSVWGQTGAASNSDNTPAPGTVQSIPVTPNVAPPSTGGAVWTGVGPAGGVLLTTPVATFDSPQPVAGISMAGRAGISDTSPVNTGLQSTLAPSTLVYMYSPGASGIPVPETENPATAAVSSEPATTDLLPSSYSAGPGPLANNNPTLAEVAARYKQQLAGLTLRTYTNADVPKENSGLLGDTYLAANHPPAMPQTSTGAGTTSRAANQSSTSANQESATAQSNSSEQQAQAQPENQGNQLPASSTILPLLGLLGLLSGGAGLLYRRKSR